METTNILLRHNFVAIPSESPASVRLPVGEQALATVLMNLAYYGKALSVEGYKHLRLLSVTGLADWWLEVEQELKVIT